MKIKLGNTRLFLSIALLIICMSAKAQLTAVHNVKSPEVANLNKFGTIPVNHFTGQPQIHIPLYEVSSGKHIVPISMSYDLSSVKPDNQGGSLGLGWNLMAGGFITRTVRCAPDETKDSRGIGHGYYFHANKMDGISGREFEEYSTKEYLEGDNWFELSADEFSFNFCGYSGNFYYTHDGWKVSSDDDIKVVFNENDGFLKYRALRMYDSHWTNQSNNDCFFNKFTLITPDGTKYEFGGKNATEYSISYYYRNTSRLVATTWRLSKITTIDGRTITFGYDTSQLIADIRFVPQYRSLQTANGCTALQPYQIGKMGYTGFLVFPVLLKSIETDDELCTFAYKTDVAYGSRFPKLSLYWKAGQAFRVAPFRFPDEDPGNQFLIFLPKTSYGSTDPYTRIKNSLCRKFLNTINIDSKHGGKSKYFSFGYTTTSGTKSVRRKVSLVQMSDDNELLWKYGFKYDSQTIGSDGEYYVINSSDSWGYYNGTNIKISDTPDFKLKNTLLQYAKAETLHEIIYPTGGKSTLEYEENDYSSMVFANHLSLKMSSGQSGGLRVKSITNRNTDGKISNKIFYYYASNKYSYPSAITSSGISSGNIEFEVVYSVPQKETKLTLKSQGGYYAPVTNSTPSVGYSTVIEEILNAENQSLGYTKYYFSNFGHNIDGEVRFDEQAISTNTTGSVYHCLPYTSRSVERGLLLKTEHYDAQNKMKKKIEYGYYKTKEPVIPTGYQQLLVFCHDPLFSSYTYMCWLTNTYMYRCLQSLVKETEYVEKSNTPIVKVQKTEYNKNKLPIVEISTTENKAIPDKIIRRQFLYETPAGIAFSDRNILSLVANETHESDGLTNGTEYFYEETEKQKIPYIKKAVRITDSGYHKELYEVLQADSYGNIVEMNEAGKNIVQIWGGNGQRLIALIENVTSEDLLWKAGVAPLSFSEMDIEEIDFDALHECYAIFPSAHITIYKYDKNMLLQSKTTPDGFTVYYKYDCESRLRETYFYENTPNGPVRKILNVFQYKYKN